MDELAKYAKTLDEVEGELMFGEIPDDLSEEENNIFDEYDAANEETFGAELDDIVDAELEDYAAQTARLRLDDPVWENPTSSVAAAPDASQIPLPFSIFGGNDSFTPLGNYNAPNNFPDQNTFLNRSIWAGTENEKASSFGIWGSDFVMGNVNPTLAADPSLGDLSALLGDDNTLYEKERKSPNVIPSMPVFAVPLKETDIITVEPQCEFDFKTAFSNLRIETNPALPNCQQESVEPIPTSLPLNALSIEELERKLIKNSANKIDDSSLSKFNISIQPEEDLMKTKMEELKSQSSEIKPPSEKHEALPQASFQQEPANSVASQFLPTILPPPPQLMVGLPKLPPLHHQFLPFVSIWLSHIVHRHLLPIGVPPPPPFLFQLLQVYKNPEIVFQMIMQSSIPLPPRVQQPVAPIMNQFTNPVPQSPVNNRYQRKPPGMPSSRTIHDLALDSFAGYMSWKEREWLVKIQVFQCKGCGDPTVEDYYYTKWKEQNIANGWTPKPVTEEVAPVKENKADYLERTRRMNYREAQKEKAHEKALLRQKERAEKGEDKKSKLTFTEKFAKSLGMPSKSSTANPRHLISMKNSEADSAEKKLSDEERKIAVAKKLRTMLLRLESAMVFLIDINELRLEKVGTHSKFKDLSSEEKEVEVEARTSVIINELMGDDLHKLLQMSKGRSVITKTLNVVSPKDQARIILAVMSAGGLVNKKAYEEMTLDILPVVYSKLNNLHPDQFSYLVRALNLDALKRQLLDSNVFIRDVMLTIFMISVKNEQPLLEWAKATKFPSLVLSNNKSLNFWRSAMKAVNDDELKQFAKVIKDSDIRDCEQLGSLIEQSLS